LFERQYDGYGKQVDIETPFLCRKNAFPNAHSVKKCKILSVKQGHPSETIKKRVYLQHFHPIPNLWVNHQQHLIHFVQLSVYAVSAFV
jgi:hypothetical protein